MTSHNPSVTRIAAVIAKEYGLGPDSAPSIVRRVLELSPAEHPTGWSRDEHCPPEELRGECCEDCAKCCTVAVAAIRNFERGAGNASHG